MNLEQIYARIWACLADATGQGRQPFAAVQVATIGVDGAPNVRTVMLRGVSEAQNLITFHTDLRSPKIAELGRDPRIALVGVDSVHNLQIRITGEARILRDGPARLEAWKSSPDHRLCVYRTLLGPGTPICEPADAFGENQVAAGDDAGLAHFCVVEVRPETLEWLEHSAANRHERARFVRDGDHWVQGWVAP